MNAAREFMMYIDGRPDNVDFIEPKPNTPEGKWFLSIQFTDL